MGKRQERQALFDVCQLNVLQYFTTKLYKLEILTEHSRVLGIVAEASSARTNTRITARLKVANTTCAKLSNLSTYCLGVGERYGLLVVTVRCADDLRGFSGDANFK